MIRFSALTGFLVIAFAARAAASPAGLTPQEQVTVDFMAAKGVPSFLMLNEKRGAMLAIEKGRVRFEVPAISGATRGDDFASTPGATAASIWPLRFSPDQTAKDAAIVFKDFGRYAYVIHRVSNGPGQRRLDRLDGRPPFTDPERDRRISDGCINLRTQDYDLVSRFAKQAESIYAENGPAPVRASFLVVLPENPDPAYTQRFLEKAGLRPHLN